MFPFRTPPTRSIVKGMDFGARMGRFNKWMMLVVYPFYLYLVKSGLGCYTAFTGFAGFAVVTPLFPD